MESTLFEFSLIAAKVVKILYIQRERKTSGQIYLTKLSKKLGKNANVGIQNGNPANVTIMYHPGTEVRHLVVEEDASPLRVNP